MSRSIRIAVTAVLVLAAILSLRQVGSLDVGFHLRAGEWILSGNGWPRTDPFTFTVSDHPYHDTSWGYQVLLAVVERIGDASGLVLLHVGFVLATFLLLIGTSRVVKGDSGSVPFLLLLGVLASEMRFEIRPEVLSYALFAGVLHLLHRHDEERAVPLWPLPLVFLAWTNTHGLVVLGWGALACFVVGSSLRHRRVDLRLAGYAAASVVIGLVNPYGWRALVFPFRLATRFGEENVFNQSIGELVSPIDLGLSEQFPFYPRLPIFAFRLLAALVLVSIPSLVRQRRYASVFLIATIVPLSLTAVRNLPLLAVACLPGVACGLRPVERMTVLVKNARVNVWLRRAAVGGVALAAAVLAVRVYHDAYYVETRRLDRFGLGWNRLTQPVEASEWAERVGLNGRVLNHLDFGGYLMWARKEPVFVDGRLEVIGEEFFEYYRGVLASPIRLEQCVERYGIEWLVFPYRGKPRLLAALNQDRRWRLAYVDHLAVAFVRDGPGVDAIVHEEVRALPRRAGVPRVTDLPGLGELRRPSPTSRWLAGMVRRVEFPAEPFHLGLFHLYRGEPAVAASRFADAVRDSNGYWYETYNNLGSALYRLGRFRDARLCYEVVLDEQPGQSIAARRIEAIDLRLASPRP